jgi:hypothetical protein
MFDRYKRLINSLMSRGGSRRPVGRGLCLDAAAAPAAVVQESKVDGRVMLMFVFLDGTQKIISTDETAAAAAARRSRHLSGRFRDGSRGGGSRQADEHGLSLLIEFCQLSFRPARRAGLYFAATTEPCRGPEGVE